MTDRRDKPKKICTSTSSNRSHTSHKVGGGGGGGGGQSESMCLDICYIVNFDYLIIDPCIDKKFYLLYSYLSFFSHLPVAFQL